MPVKPQVGALSWPCPPGAAWGRKPARPGSSSLASRPMAGVTVRPASEGTAVRSRDWWEGQRRPSGAALRSWWRQRHQERNGPLTKRQMTHRHMPSPKRPLLRPTSPSARPAEAEQPFDLALGSVWPSSGLSPVPVGGPPAVLGDGPGGPTPKHSLCLLQLPRPLEVLDGYVSRPLVSLSTAS